MRGAWEKKASEECFAQGGLHEGMLRPNGAQHDRRVVNLSETKDLGGRPGDASSETDSA